ncbi:MAG TPA: RdgB/HAM1 family non-canonical purine NTP pyrophosphatase [Anaerolineales bacterium]|nr:RdgB/HAM1 family non-canonical purine NTP pyrophosphatase [Anaerolineales bacterium]
MNKLLIATNNKGKIEELHDLLKEIGIQLITPAEINLELDVQEDGLTYAENAVKKAIAFAGASGLISLADDSGLEVDALDGGPGLYSARYGCAGGRKLSDADRRAFLIKNLQDKPRPWTARFHATIAVAIPSHLWSQAARRLHLHEPDPIAQMFEGYCPGEIIPEERGSGGFGYDPIFLLPELGKTMAELNMDEKNRLSHRARAVMNGRKFLKALFSGSG